MPYVIVDKVDKTVCLMWVRIYTNGINAPFRKLTFLFYLLEGLFEICQTQSTMQIELGSGTSQMVSFLS